MLIKTPYHDKKDLTRLFTVVFLPQSWTLFRGELMHLLSYSLLSCSYPGGSSPARVTPPFFILNQGKLWL